MSFSFMSLRQKQETFLSNGEWIFYTTWIKNKKKTTRSAARTQKYQYPFVCLFFKLQPHTHVLLPWQPPPPPLWLLWRQCVGERSRHAWMLTVNPPARVHRGTRGAWHNKWLHTRTETDFSVWALDLTSGQPFCQSLTVHPIISCHCRPLSCKCTGTPSQWQESPSARLTDSPSFDVVQKGDFNVHEERQQRHLRANGQQPDQSRLVKIT